MTLQTPAPRFGSPLILPGLTESGSGARPLELLNRPAATAPAVVADPAVIAELEENLARLDVDRQVRVPELVEAAPVTSSVLVEPVTAPVTAPDPAPVTAADPVWELELEAEPSTSRDPRRTFSQIEPDRRWVMVVAIFILGTVLVSALVASFTSVYAMASWVGLPAYVQWLPVVILDVAIVGFSWALMVFAGRGDRTWTTRLLIALVTSFSVAANSMHTYDHWDGDLSSPQAIMGIIFSASIPVFSLFATETLIRLAFKPTKNRKEQTA